MQQLIKKVVETIKKLLNYLGIHIHTRLKVKSAKDLENLRIKARYDKELFAEIAGIHIGTGNCMDYLIDRVEYDDHGIPRTIVKDIKTE